MFPPRIQPYHDSLGQPGRLAAFNAGNTVVRLAVGSLPGVVCGGVDFPRSGKRLGRGAGARRFTARAAPRPAFGRLAGRARACLARAGRIPVAFRAGL